MDEITQKIQFFKDTHKPGTPYYFDQSGQIRKGIIKFQYCRICGIDIEEMRDNDPQHVRKIKFCSENCKKEYNRRKKIRKETSVDLLLWPTYNGQKFPERREMRMIRIGKVEEKFKAKRRKSKNHA